MADTFNQFDPEESFEAKTKRAAEILAEQQRVASEEKEWAAKLQASKAEAAVLEQAEEQQAANQPNAGQPRRGGSVNGGVVYRTPTGQIFEVPGDVKKKLDKLDKEIKEEKKKTSLDYAAIYLGLLVAGATFDVIGVICDFSAYLSWINLIIGPVYAGGRYVGVHYANLSLDSRELEKMNSLITLTSGAISCTGIPSRTVSMVMQFGAREKIARDAHQLIIKKQADHKKLLMPYGRAPRYLN